MAQFFECFACMKVMPLTDDTQKACPGCGSRNGQVIPYEQVKKAMDVGTVYNIDPRTGKRSKKK